MLNGLLGRKIGMMRLFNEGGAAVGVTVIQAGPCHVMQVKTPAVDGYSAVQLGFDDRKRSRATKPEGGHARKAGVEPKRFVRELRVAGDAGVTPGAVVDVKVLEGVKTVDVVGTTKGRGFTGVMKRHGFKGFSRTHGVSKVHRAPGSIGSSAFPSRVFKGTRMPGHHGHARSTSQHLRVVGMDTEKNLLFVRGAVPGPNGGYVIVKRCARAAPSASRRTSPSSIGKAAKT